MKPLFVLRTDRAAYLRGRQSRLILFILLPVAGSLFATAAQDAKALLGRAQRAFAGAAEDAALAAAAEQLSAQLESETPVLWDWWVQDSGPDFQAWFSSTTLREAVRPAAAQVLAELGPAGSGLSIEWEGLVRRGGEGEAWLDLYLRAAELRRETRLRRLRRCNARWIFTKRHTFGGSHYAYTEGQSDAQHERHFAPGAALCQLDLTHAQPTVLHLLQDPHGVFRDPDVSWDGRHVLFAWKQSDREDDYHLYEMSVADGAVTQLTRGLGFADYEGVYLPNNDLLFNSTRCVQTVDCWWTEVSNLYSAAPDGRALRRLTFDQVHDNYPTVAPDGRIIYTRWEYNDRGQIFVQGLFQMRPDGTGQSELYGNNSWFPTSLLHARGIPGTGKMIAIFSGHHTLQMGKLGIVDPARGRQENAGTQLIAPIRDTPAEKIDAYGQDGILFQYPYPLSESEFVVAAAPPGCAQTPARFKLYWIAADGRRELLAADPRLSCSQPVPMAARPRPPVRTSEVDLQQSHGTCYLQNVYHGPGLAGVTRGTVKKLRLIALDYRAAGIGWNYNSGPAGEALVSTPIAIGNGSWDVKIVLGEATVHPDGSAYFKVPARTPLYLQPIDAHGHAAQTMRSWMTLQPGENSSCLGCHEDKNAAPPLPLPLTLALQAGAQDLIPFHGPPRGFSFPREIQPILDRHCIRCHRDESKWHERLDLQILPVPPVRDGPRPDPDIAFSLLNTPVTEELALRHWSASYLALLHATERFLEGHSYLAAQHTSLVNWVDVQSSPEQLRPYSAGAARSALLTMLIHGHHQVQLEPESMEKLACWIDLQVPFCGDYEEANAWTTEDRRKYQHFLNKRRGMAILEHQSFSGEIRQIFTRNPPVNLDP